MKRFLCKKKLVKDHVVELDSDFYHHAIRVLKIKTNESIVLFNENGKEFYCKIQKILKKSVLVEIQYELDSLSDKRSSIKVFQSIPKGNLIDDLIEKSVELGVTSFNPVISKRTIKKTKEKKERWNEIIKNATEQCGRTDLMQISEPIQFNEIFNQDHNGEKIIFYENSDVTISETNFTKSDKVSIIIGPEGGFTDEEIKLAKENEFKIFSLGKNILKCSTANILAIGIVSLFSS